MPYSSFEKRKRWAARLALYGSLALVLVSMGALGWLAVRFSRTDFQGAWEEREWLELEEVRRLVEYVRIDTSEETGSELEGARYLADLLAEEGIESHIEELADGKANLWAIVEGKSPEALVLHNHIDVTAIQDPEAWDFDPFAAELDLPWIYGRGVFDMKSVTIAQLQAILALKRSGVELERSIVFLATSSEEKGSDLGTKRILALYPELVERFWAVLTEGGVVEAVTRDEVKYWGIEFAQKRLLRARACSSSRERLEDLRADLLAVRERGLEQAPPAVAPEVAEFSRAYGPTRSSLFARQRLEDPDFVLSSNGWAWNRMTPYLRSMFIDEAFPLQIVESESGEYELPISILLRPGSNGERALEELLMPWAHGLQVSLEEPIGSAEGSPTNHPLYRALAENVLERYPDAAVGPFILTYSATDARFFREAGIPTFGFSPFLILTTDTLQVDQANERLSVPGFVGGVELYTELVRELVTAPRSGPANTP